MNGIVAPLPCEARLGLAVSCDLIQPIKKRSTTAGLWASGALAWHVTELLRNGSYSGQRSRCGKSGNFLERDEMPAVIAFERTGKLCIMKRESYQALIARYDEK